MHAFPRLVGVFCPALPTSPDRRPSGKRLKDAPPLSLDCSSRWCCSLFRPAKRKDVCRIGRPFARTLNGHPPRARFACSRPLRFSKGALVVSVWLAFVGGASVCSASEPCSYNGLSNRVLAAFRPSSQTSFTTCGGHRRRVVCWRPRVVPLAACLPLFSCLFSASRPQVARAPGAAMFLFRAPFR